MNSSFEAVARIQEIAEAYARDAVVFARDRFQLPLDWSDDSIKNVEAILAQMHDEMADAQPSQEQIDEIAKGFGSYLGEVFRKNHGARWGMVMLGSEAFPGLEMDAAVSHFWPWSKVQNRLLNGPEDNLWQYYQWLVPRGAK